MPIDDTTGFRDTRKEEAQKNFTDSLKDGRFGKVYRDTKGVIHAYDKFALNPLEYFDARQIAKESPIGYSIERDIAEGEHDMNAYAADEPLRDAKKQLDSWYTLQAKLDQERKEETIRREALGLPLTDEEKFEGLRDPGKTRINDITVSIPPEQIHIQTSIKNVSVATLRSHATQKIRTGHGYVQISLPLVFTDFNQVNTQLVPLVYQLRKAPFCRIENAFLRKVLMPHVDDEKRALMFTLQSLNVHTVENLPTTLRCNLQLLWFNYLPYTSDIKYRKDFTLAQISANVNRQEYYAPGPLSPPLAWSDMQRGPSIIPDDIKYSYDENNLHETVRLLNRTGGTREEKVHVYNQAQIAVNDPGDSWAWGEFAKGYKNNLLWGGSDKDPETGEALPREFGPHLTPEVSFAMSYEKYRKSSPPAKEASLWREERRGPSIWSRIVPFFATPDFIPIHVNVAFTNRIAPLPLLDQRLPTHQFLGSMDRELVVTFFVTEAGQSTLKIFSEYIEDFEKQVLDFRSFTKDRWMEVKTPVAKLAGMIKVVPEKIDIQTVPGNPGASMVRVFFSEYSPFSFREPRKVSGGIRGVLKSFCQAIFDRLSGGDPSRILLVLDDEKDRIRKIEDRIRSSYESQVGTLTRRLPELFDKQLPSEDIIARQARKEYRETWLNEDSTSDDGISAMHGIEEFATKIPKAWLELIGGPSHTEPKWYQFGILFANQGTNSRLWRAARDIVLITQNNKEGFAYADDTDAFGLKTLVEQGFVYRGKRYSAKELAGKADRLAEDLYNTLFTWLTKTDGLSTDFPNLFLELTNQFRDLNSCYPDLDLPPHPATGEFVDTEPDFYLYNPLQLDGTDLEATEDFQRAMKDASQLMRQDAQTAPDTERNKVVEFTSLTYGNTGHGQSINVADMPRGTRDSTPYKALQDETLIPKDRWLNEKVTPSSIAESAKESVKKRHELGMRKAFPTFRLYFIKEGRDQVTYEGFQEMWGGFAVKEIRFVSSRKIPADMCVISMANLDGFLETDRLDEDVRADASQYETDQVRIRSAEEDMLTYQKHYDRIDFWIKHYNQMRSTNLDISWVAKLMDWEKSNPTPNGGGPLGTTPEHALMADGKELTVAELKVPETSIRIACDVLSLYAIDLAGYDSSFYYNEIALTQYRFPEHASDVFQAIAEQISDAQGGARIPEDWYKRIQDVKVRRFVQFMRPSRTAMAQSRKAAIDRDIAKKVLEIRKHQERLDGLVASEKDGQDTSKTNKMSADKAYKGSIDDSGNWFDKFWKGSILAPDTGVKDDLDAVNISLSSSSKIQQEQGLLKYLKKEVAQLKLQRDRYVTNKIITEGVLFSEGTDIVLKMGYSNDPEKLETVFVGHVVEAQPAPGEVIVMAQTFATELVQEVKGLDEDMTEKGEQHLYRLTEWMLTMPEVKHFGRWQWRAESWEDEMEMRGIDEGDPISEVHGSALPDEGFLGWALKYSGLKGLEKVAATRLMNKYDFNNNPSDDNIYIVTEGEDIPTNVRLRQKGHSFLAAAVEAAGYAGLFLPEYNPILEDFTLNQRTLWQGLIDLQHNFPGYVVGVRPYSEGTRKGTWWRNTLFFGLPDMTYLTKTPDPVTWERYRQRTTELKRTLKAQTHFTLPEDIDPWAKPYADQLTQESLYKEYQKATIERREPFRRYHTITSYSDIIDNGIVTTKRGNYNGVTLRGRDLEGRHTDDDIVRKQLDGMDESNIRWLYVDNENARGERGEFVCKSLLMEVLRDIYTGEITILGNPEIRPYDIVYLNDNYNEMFGPVEVEQVVHTFSEDTGFITQIVPDLVVTAADQIKTSIIGPMGVYAYRHMLQLAGIDWRVAASERTTWENFRKGVIGAGSTVAMALLMVAFPIHFLPIIFLGHYFNNWITESDRIRIQPVFHKGKPFVTGVQGFQNPESLNPVMNAVQLWLKSTGGDRQVTSQFLSDLFDSSKTEALLEYGYYKLYHTN